MYGKCFPVGTVLFEEGEEGHEMYVVQSGKVKITRRVGAKDTLLAVLSAGEFLGEMSIINDRPRSATATVIEDARLLVIDGQTFEAMIRGNSEIAVRMIKRLADRLDNADAQIELLLHRDPNYRVVQLLRQEAGRRGPSARTASRISLSDEALAERVGLSVQEVTQVIDRLAQARLVARSPDGGFVVAESGKLQEFLEFLDMKERFTT